MQKNPSDERRPAWAARWTAWSAAGGGLLWLALLGASAADRLLLSEPEVLLLFAYLVLAPLAVSLVRLPREGPRSWPRILEGAVRLQPAAAVLAVLSFLLDRGAAAAVLALGWLAFATLAALAGLRRALRPGIRRLDEACAVFGLLYLVPGGLFLVASRLGVNPLGFNDLIIFLTAVHFSYVPLAVLVPAALAGRRLAFNGRVPARAWRPAAVGLIVAPALVAAGFVLSSGLQAGAVVLLSASLALLSLLVLAVVAPRAASPPARVLLGLASVVVLPAMVYASVYSLGEATGAWTVSIPRMVHAHGWVNALGFSLCGLIGWRLEEGRRGPGRP